MRIFLGLLLAPALWPLIFIAVWISVPGVIDPLLAGLHHFLYVGFLVWVLAIIGGTALLARMCSLQATRTLFLLTNTACAAAAALLLFGYGALGCYTDGPRIACRGISQPAQELMLDCARLVGLWVAATSLTAYAFLAVSGARAFKPRT
ncbi:hypothetical protein [Phenylobacterium sp.]|uniref:hypothetical protein n=1 Tax=Phenylobacterium sp. TaxID=1871053 RepID=UPI0035B16121